MRGKNFTLIIKPSWQSRGVRLGDLIKGIDRIEGDIIYMNPEDAKSLRLKDGNLILIAELGIKRKVKLDTIPKGFLFSYGEKSGRYRVEVRCMRS
ncbi:hypothetical protein DRP53_02645 [candidate division WOR-3 bacterium]|uniref:CDC48 N-terminal subdomain domain-containing protein n=1 Tax=candidate division WOR-3 bacterium TaxID=2052148 RepID=A0A660SK73_UNCW3|nr:MAG: hypothetical protein DRP53_02645 [candidate division WOR-3 bacterium]